MSKTKPVSIRQCFADVPDPRREHMWFHNLWDIFAITILAVIGGADSWVEVANYGLSKLDWLQSFLELPNGIPSHDTFNRVFALLNPTAFQEGFLNWVRAIAKNTLGRLVAIDGKTLRGGRENDRRGAQRGRDRAGQPGGPGDEGEFPEGEGLLPGRGKSPNPKGDPSQRLRANPYDVGVEGESRQGRRQGLDTNMVGRGANMPSRLQYLGVLGQYRKMMEEAIARLRAAHPKTVFVHVTAPLTVRDGIGKFVDTAMDPLAYYLPFFWDRLGMKVGDSKKVTVKPEEAYGALDPKAEAEVPKNALPEGAAVVGTRLLARGQDGQPRPVTVKAVKDTTVVLDLNHPLAGKTLFFDVKVVSVEPPAK